MKYRCMHCGWRGEGYEIPYTTVHEDYGDVDVLYCPSCKEVEFDGYKLFKEIKEMGDD